MVKLLVLISGGIDSPVAAYLMFKNTKHASVDFIFFFIGADKAIVKNCIKQVKKQLGIKRKIKLFIVPYKKNLSVFASIHQKNLQCVLCKRMMLRIASKVAEKYGYDVLVTGDSLGQVASQTLENLFVEDRASNKPVMRPLIGWDKQDIVNLAEKIGTFEYSRKHAGCRVAPKNPRTKARMEEVERVEGDINIEDLVKKSMKMLKTVEI